MGLKHGSVTWEENEQVREEFSSFEGYRAYRKAELEGRIPQREEEEQE